MRAAGAQKLCDLGLVSVAVELGLQRIGRGGDLAQRECGGKNLDEEGFHRGLADAKRAPSGVLSQRIKVAFWRVRSTTDNLAASPCGRAIRPDSRRKVHPSDAGNSFTAGKYVVEIVLKIAPSGPRRKSAAQENRRACR